MQYEDITHVDQAQIVRNSIRELEAQHMNLCVNLVANKGVPGANLKELEQRKAAIELGLRNLRREYAALLAEPVEPSEDQGEMSPVALEEPQRNGHALHAVGAE